MSFPHINLKTRKAHTTVQTLSFHVWVLTAILFKKKSIAISRQQEKKKQYTPGLRIDKSSITEPLSFLSFKRVYDSRET